ncbi:MAG: thiolase family protein [Candidatus Omnitrophota bacterium]
MPHSEVYIIDALRTPFARPFSRLQEFDSAGLAALLLDEFRERHFSGSCHPDAVILGSTVTAGTGQNFVRRALLDAGFALTVPGFCVDSVCGSGMQAVLTASRMIRSGDAGVVIAGGTESVSHMPGLVFKAGHKSGGVKDENESLVQDGLLCSVTGQHMGILCEDLAGREGISRAQQDDAAFASYNKALAAREAGKIRKEIMPIRLQSGQTLTRDETLRKNLTRAGFDQFRPVFRKNGTITAANSSAPCDGAALLVLAGAEAVKRQGWQPLARICSVSQVAGDPRETFALAVPAVKKAIQEHNFNLDDIGLIELSEAFSAQVIYTARELGIDPRRLNIYGGDAAIGHPLGAAGARILTTLTHALGQEQVRRGLACVCFGGGGSLAAVLERLD